MCERNDFLSKLVFFSNSLPKSGSTFLHAMQENFLINLAGRGKPDYSELTDQGIKMSRSYVHDPSCEKLLYLIENEKLKSGPYVLKIHAPISKRMRQIYFSNSTVYFSLAIRDPIEIFLSAQDNNNKTGEFTEFQDIERGSRLINGYFMEIYKTTILASKEKNIPVIQYENIVNNPYRALMNSFPEQLLEQIFIRLAEEKLDINSARQLAKNRFNIGDLNRAKEMDHTILESLEKRLKKARKTLGYK